MNDKLQANVYGDDAEPIFVGHEGDNEYAIFQPEIGTYQLVILSIATETPLVMRDESWSSMAEAAASLSLFLISEYAA